MGGNASRGKFRQGKCGQGVMQAGRNTGRGKRRHGEMQAGDRQHEEHANVHIDFEPWRHILKLHMETHSGAGESRIEVTGAHY